MKAIRAVLVSRGQAGSAEEARRIAERFGVRGAMGGKLEPVSIARARRYWRIVVRRPERFVRGSVETELRAHGIVVEWGILTRAPRT